METVEDPEFGLLTWDPELAAWRGRSVMTDGSDFAICIVTRAENQPSAEVRYNPDQTITSRSRAALRSIRRGDAHIRAKVADQHIALYSEWHNGETISPLEFQSRLRLDSIRARSGGELEIYYSDDGMFYGNSLIAHLRADGHLRLVEMFG